MLHQIVSTYEMVKKLPEYSDIPINELDNRIFFRLYQCANMMHKTGTRAVEAEGITTQQWAVLGALSHPDADAGMSVGELAEFLMVSRQNLSGVVARLEALGHLRKTKDASDGRARRIRLTEKGEALWQRLTPMIHDYYTDALGGFSFDDRVDLLYRLNGLLGNLKSL